jgi:hypothetical protein
MTRRWKCPIADCRHPWGWRSPPFDVTCDGCGTRFFIECHEGCEWASGLTIRLDRVESNQPS